MTTSPRSSRHDLTAEFDEFYSSARDQLLLQSFALTGDLTAARSGVRDAFVVAWHHWRKTFHSEDPLATVREHAWRNTLRRTSARRWQRDQGFDAETCGILDALGDLPKAQRRLLVATQLAGMTMLEAARDVALPLDVAERELAVGAAAFAKVRALENSEIPSALAALAPATRTVRWPRVTIIRRAGLARKRAHTIAGTIAVAVALVATGVVVTDPTGARPQLDRQSEATPEAILTDVDAPQVVLPDTVMLPTDQVQKTLGGAGWRVRRTDDNSEGDGRVLACQQARYADPRGQAAWVRVLSSGRIRDGGNRLTQTAEASVTDRTARRTYQNYLDWFAGCVAAAAEDEAAAPQHRLSSTWSVAGVGNQAHLFVLRNDQSGRALATAVARTGRLVTVVSLEADALALELPIDQVAELLGIAVDRMCELPAAGRCTTSPEPTEIAVMPAGDVPAMLSEWDLPPAGAGTGHWVGPAAKRVNEENGTLGMLACNRISFAGEFRGAEFRQGRVRSFVLPTADLPTEFGLSQMVAALPRQRAGALADRVKARIEGCPTTGTGAGTTVESLREESSGNRRLMVWRLRTELTEGRALTYNIAFLRRGSSVSVLLFISVPDARMTDEDFVRVSERAMHRLRELPSYAD